MRYMMIMETIVIVKLIGEGGDMMMRMVIMGNDGTSFFKTCVCDDTSLI